MHRFRPLRFSTLTVEVESDLGTHRAVPIEIWNDDASPRELRRIAITESGAFGSSESTAFVVGQVPATIAPGTAATIMVHFTPNTDNDTRAKLSAIPEHGATSSLALIGRTTRRMPTPSRVPTNPPARLERPRSPTGSLLSPAPEVVDFGEQVFGSNETRRIGAPFNLTQLPAVATFTIEGTSFRLLSAKTLTLSPSGQMNMAMWEHNSPLVEYDPASVTNRGALITTVVWGDGTTEVQRVPLVGRGRLRDEAPNQTPSPQEIAEESARTKRVESERALEEKRVAEDQAKTKNYAQNAENLLGSAFDDTKVAAMGLANAQKRGTEMVKTHAQNYRKATQGPRDSSIWMNLLEIGLNMATAGIAAQVSKKLLPSLLGALTGGDESRKLSEFTTEVVKEGLKTAGKSAAKAVLAGGAGMRGGPLADHMADFFGGQEKAHDLQAQNNATMINKRRDALRPLLRTEPEKAASVMTVLGKQFREEAEFAAQEQQRVTSALWTVNIARRSLGAEEAKTSDGQSLEATRLDDARKVEHAKMPRARDGLLDIALRRNDPFPQIESARMFGVSKTTLDFLRERRVDDIPMPMRFVLDRADKIPTIITRDETGRVRVSGDLLYLVRFSSSKLDLKAAREAEQIGPIRRDSFRVSEAEAIAGAMVVVERILSRSLAEWGVNFIEHDDVGKEGK